MKFLQEFPLVLPVIGGLAASASIVLNERRWMILALLGIYACLAIHMFANLSVLVGAVKFVTGATVCLILELSQIRTKWVPQKRRGSAIPADIIFRIAGSMLVVIAVLGISRREFTIFPGIARNVSIGGMLMLGLGLLQLGISDDAFRVGLGLLTTLSGFEVGYSLMEPSLSVLALLASVHLGIALVVSYLMIAVEPLGDGGATRP